MTSFRPTKVEQFAVEAKLNMVFGAHIYDRIFLGFEILEVANDELCAWSPTEHCAAVIDVYYAEKVAWIAQTVFNRPVRRVNVMMRGLRHEPRRSGEQSRPARPR
jgi:hypothetical protein